MNAFERHQVTMREFKRGHLWQEFVAAFFRAKELPAVVPDLEVREKPSTSPYDNDRGDIWVGPILVESKSTYLRFTEPGNFPYPAPMVDSVPKWDFMIEKPKVYVVVSQVNGSMMWISVKESFHDWFKKVEWNTKTKQEELVFKCPKKWWYPIEDLVTTLRAELAEKREVKAHVD